MLIRGWASTARLCGGGIIAPGAFGLAIAARGPGRIALRLDHDPAYPAGRISKLVERPEGLWCEAELMPALKGVAARIAAILRGGGHGLSIGGFKRRFRRNPDGSLLIHTIDLREISLTAYPRNADCQIEFDRPKAGLWPSELGDAFAAMDARPQPAIAFPPIQYGAAT